MLNLRTTHPRGTTLLTLSADYTFFESKNKKIKEKRVRACVCGFFFVTLQPILHEA